VENRAWDWLRAMEIIGLVDEDWLQFDIKNQLVKVRILKLRGEKFLLIRTLGKDYFEREIIFD
jgi:hypothetical protein